MIKVTFIEPPYSFYGQGSLYNTPLPLLWMETLGTYLKKMADNQITINFLDGQILKLEQMLKELNKIKPQFVGLCPKYSSYKNALIIARAAKKLGARIVMGGSHADPLAKEILLNRGSFSADYCVDVIIRGDGEKAFYEYIFGNDLSKIKNLVFVKDGEIIENPIEYLNLDKMPIIDRDLINSAPYFHLLKQKNQKREMVWPVFTHKGCFYGSFKSQGCIFCGGDKNLRLKPPLDFWKEIDCLVKKYNAGCVANFADGFPVDVNSVWFREFYKAASFCRKKPKLILRTLPLFINVQTVKILKELNVETVRLPITGLHPGCACNSFGKYSTKKLEELCSPLKLLSQAGIRVVTYFIPGAFREKEDDFKKILEISRILSKLKNVYILFSRGHLPFPGSKGWQILLEKTGGKYQNQDLIDWQEVGRDWMRHFSNLKLAPLIKLIGDTVPNVGKWMNL